MKYYFFLLLLYISDSFYLLCDMCHFCQGPKGCFAGTSVQQEAVQVGLPARTNFPRARGWQHDLYTPVAAF